MTRKSRHFFIVFLIVLFLIIGALVLFYAQGWRLDFARLKLIKVGAIYAKTFPADAQIYLDNRPVQENRGFFDSGIFVGNVLPGNHRLKISSPDYRDWMETVTVEPSLVKEVLAVLVPKNPQPALAGDNVKNFWLLGSKIIIQDHKNKIFAGNNFIPGDEARGWTDDSQSILTKTSLTGNYFWNSLSDASSQININSILKKSGLNFSTNNGMVEVDPSENGNLIVKSRYSLSTFDLITSRISFSRQTTSTISAVTASPTWIVWTTESGGSSSNLTIHNKFSGTTGEMGAKIAGKTIKVKIIGDGKTGILQDDGGFYIYDLTSGELNKTASDAKDFLFSADGNMVAVLENSAMEIFSLDGSGNYWRFRLPDSNEAESLIWYKDNEHLLVKYPEKFLFLDLNDGSLQNFQEVAETSSGQYDQSSNKFYFLKNGKILSLQFP